MQKVLYIDKLDYLSLLMGVVSNFRFKRVYFHNAISTFQTKKSHKLLKYLGIHWISFVGLPVNSYLKYFQLNLDLGKR